MAHNLNLKKDYNFYCKSRKKYKKGFTKDFFERLYLKDKKSIREIAKIMDLGKNTIDYYLIKYNIKKRNKNEAGKLRGIKYSSWRKGLKKETDKRILATAEKSKKTSLKKRKEKLKKIEEKWDKSIDKLINELYWNKNLTQKKIAKKLGLPREIIIGLMKEFEISKRLNYEHISNLKGKNHSMYGKTWEKIHGIEKAKLRKKQFSLRARKNIIRRLKNNEIPFLNTKIEIKIIKKKNPLFTTICFREKICM